MNARRTRFWLGAAVGLLLIAAAAVGAKAVLRGAQTWLYGYPLVIMDLTRQQAARNSLPENQLLRVRRFPDATFKAVVRPNVDTLYTTAFIDMARGPWVFEMPANGERYELMPFMDMWTHVYAAPGTRTTGRGGGRFLLVGPRWQGTVPEGMTLLRCPTRWAWLVGRTQTNGAADYELVHRLQDGLVLRPLDGSAPPTSQLPPSTSAMPPAQQLQAMRSTEFYTRLAALMVDNPPVADDAAMLRELQAMGVAPGQPPQWQGLQAWQRWTADAGRWLADRRIAQVLSSPVGVVGGWSTPPANLGRYRTEPPGTPGIDYGTRAVVAMVGLGANEPQDALYPSARVDAAGEPLNGDRRYRLHFAAGQLPPVNAFWSVTAYGSDDFLIANPLNRHALGDRDPLVFNADGSLDLWVQATEPEPARRANWLPVRNGEAFLLNARLYWPRAEALDGRWRMPQVQRLP